MTRDFVLPVLVAASLVFLVQVDAISGGLIMLSALALAVLAFILGAKLPMAFRVLMTGIIIFATYGLCVAGRAMGPGLTAEGVARTLQIAAIYGGPMLLSFFRLWPKRVAFSIVGAAVPLCFATALFVADLEGRAFVACYHETGSGPLPRTWTDSNSWLSYDAETHTLSGAD